MFRVHMFRADIGDSFLIEIGDSTECRILVDTGTATAWKKNIFPILVKACKEIDLMVITHIDRDHIGGAVDLLSQKSAYSLTIKEIWFNGLKQMLRGEASSISEDYRELPSYIPPMSETGIESNDISYYDGITLSGLLHNLPQLWNTTFQGAAISEKSSTVAIGNSVKIMPILPTEESLNKVFKGFQNELRQQRSDQWFPDSPALQDAFEQFCYQNQSLWVESNDISLNSQKDISVLSKAVVLPDQSLTNASSIGFILEFRERRVLFLGDATPKVSISALQHWSEQTGNPLYFDAIKMPHHGSKRNCMELLDYVDSPIYLISSDGSQYNHPSPETIAKIISRPTEQSRCIVFNYPHSVYKQFNDSEWMAKYHYRVTVAEIIDFMEVQHDGTI